MDTAGYTPAPEAARQSSAPEPSPPCQLLFASAVWDSWQFRFTGYTPDQLQAHSKDPHSSMARILAGKKIKKPDPTSEWDVTNHFAYDFKTATHTCVTKYKDGSKQKNLFGIEEFLSIDDIAIVTSTPALCSSIDFVETFESMKEISEEQAFHNSLLQNFDESMKPVRQRVGKRVGGLPPMPQTAQAPRTGAPGGSTDRVSR